MNVIGTAILLIVTLLVVPAVSFISGALPGPAELQVLRVLVSFVLVAWVWCFLAGELTGNVSQVDKLWSLLPIVYTWTVAGYGGFTPRLLLMAVLVSIWGLRLTYNFSRHGAYQLKFWRGHEDYRWQVLRQKPEFQPRWKWTLFNLVFISGYQNFLILFFTTPAVVALAYATTPLGWLDCLAAVLMLFMIAIETVADNQQWQYQSAKHTSPGSGGTANNEFAKGFLDKGLWAYSRHPNYLAEQCIWIAFYLFSVAASGQWINWSLAGCLLLVILFRGSSVFSEEISASKYPAYREYQETVPRFIPINLFPGTPE